MKITIIHPTISVRADAMARRLEEYRTRTPGYELEFITVVDRPSWPAGYNEGMRRGPTGDVIFIGSDDVEPIEGWADAMMSCLVGGVVPGSYYWNHPAGAEEPCGYAPVGDPVNLAADGPPGASPRFSRGPALTREMAERIGPWPEIPYYADNWVSDKARLLGYEVRMVAGYDFVHHWDQRGRLDGNGHVQYAGLYNAERAKLGLPPVPG